MDFAGNKKAALPEISEHTFFEPTHDLWSYVGKDDNELVVSKEALEGPDVWVDLDGLDLFFSRRLGDAIKAAKPKGRIKMIKCKVQEG